MSDSWNKKDSWNKIQWELSEFVDIMHDMKDGGNGFNPDSNELFNKCLEKLGYMDYKNSSNTQSSKIKYQLELILH